MTVRPVRSSYRHLGTFGLMVVMLLAGFLPHPPKVYAAPSEAPALAQQIVELTNAERRAQGVAPLKLQNNLHDAAMWMAQDMADNNYFSHTDRYGRSISTRLPAFGYSFDYAIGENIARGQTSPSAAIAAWMSSTQGHRENMLNSRYCEIGAGYGLATGGVTPYWVQDFGCRLGVYPIIINDEAAITTSSNVSLYIYGLGWAQQMRLSNDGNGWTDWETYQSTRSWTLAPGNGSRTVFVELRNGGTVRRSDDSILVDAPIPTPAPPAAPSDLYVSGATATSVSLAWRDNANDEQGYVIYKWMYGSSGWEFYPLANISANSTTFTESGLACGENSYYYQVSAFNAAGESAWAGWVKGVTLSCPTPTSTPTPTPPAMPSDLYVSGVTAMSISLAWRDNASDEQGYLIYKWMDGTNGWEFYPLVIIDANSTTFTEAGLACGENSYYYQVSAFNAAGESARAGWVKGVTLPCPTATPTKTNAPTPTRSVTPTSTRVTTPTSTRTTTPTSTRAPTPTPTRSATLTPTRVTTSTPTRSVTLTPTRATTSTPTRSVTPTSTRVTTSTPTRSVTPTRATTSTPTRSITPTRVTTPTPTRTITLTPTRAATPTPTRSATPTRATTSTPTRSVTLTPTRVTTSTPTRSITVTPGNGSTETSVPNVTETVVPKPTASEPVPTTPISTIPTFTPSPVTQPTPDQVFLPLILFQNIQPTPIPPSPTPDDNSSPADRAIARANMYRQQASIPSLRSHQAIVEAAKNHSNYYVQNWKNKGAFPNNNPHGEVEGYPEYTGKAFWDRMRSTNYIDGSPRFEVMHFLNNPESAIDDWIASVYHRIPFIDPSIDEAGYGSATLNEASADVMDFGSSADASTFPSDRVIVYPADGQVNIPRAWNCNESPNPYADIGCNGTRPVGYVITALARNGKQLISLTLTTLSASPVAIIPLRYDSDFDVYYATATRPLASNTTYVAKLEGTNQDGTSLVITWQFTTSDQMYHNTLFNHPIKSMPDFSNLPR